MMQIWLDENMPDAEITECAAFINNITYSSREYLVDYATGHIVENGVEYAFAIDTLTGDVYFENDQSVAAQLNEIAAEFLYETMGITQKDTADDFEMFEKLSEECGMMFGYISVENGTQVSKRAIRDWVTSTSFYEYGRWGEWDDFYITGRVRVRQEQRDDLTGEMTVSDRRFNLQQDLVFEKIETGYEYYLPNEDWEDEVFYIHAHEGAEILEYDYILYFHGDVAGFMAGEYDSKEKDGIEVIWLEQTNGDYVLSSKKNEYPFGFSHAGKLERIE